MNAKGQPRSSLTGQRILLAAEYIGHGGTREYFKDLVRFYADERAEVLALTTYSSNDTEMKSFLRNYGFGLMSFEDFVHDFGDGLSWKMPTVWNPIRARQERRMFIRLCDEAGIGRVVVSVGTSGLFLSATHVRPDPIMIAHGYPHGRRQEIFGKTFHGDRTPADLRIVSVSEFSADLFRQVWYKRNETDAVRTIWSSCGQPILNTTPLAARHRSVVTASLVEHYKEPFRWIDIAHHVSQSDEQLVRSRFSWMGDGPLLNQARHYAQRTGNSLIQFPGWDDDPGKEYQRSRVYLQTSSKEALGLSVVDAVRHGLPCVVADVGGLPEVVLDNVNGFVVSPGDVAAASEAVRELLLNDSTWLKMSKSANEVYRERFTPEMWKENMLAAHES